VGLLNCLEVGSVVKREDIKLERTFTLVSLAIHSVKHGTSLTNKKQAQRFVAILCVIIYSGRGAVIIGSYMLNPSDPSVLIEEFRGRGACCKMVLVEDGGVL
jgi:hypothetical protein